MNGIEHLCELARLYGEAEGIEPVTVSWRVFGDSKKLGAIQAGADIQLGRFEKAVRWFSDNWPAAAAWPQGLTRPTASEQAA